MTRNCSDCGADVRDDARFCQHCGQPLDASDAPDRADPSSPDKVNVTADAANDVAAPAEQALEFVEGEGVSTDQEEPLWDGGYSAKAMMGAWVLAAALTAIGGGAAIHLLGVAKGLFVLLVCAVVFFGGVALFLMYLKLRAHYSLSTQRFVHQSGLLRRVTDRIEVIDIDDVAYAQGPVQRMMGVGTIKIISSDRTHPELFLHGIDQVEAVARKIDDARRDERRRRGLFIEAI